VTSMEELLGALIDLSAVEDRLIANFLDVFSMTIAEESFSSV